MELRKNIWNCLVRRKLEINIFFLIFYNDRSHSLHTEEKSLGIWYVGIYHVIKGSICDIQSDMDIEMSLVPVAVDTVDTSWCLPCLTHVLLNLRHACQCVSCSIDSFVNKVLTLQPFYHHYFLDKKPNFNMLYMCVHMTLKCASSFEMASECQNLIMDTMSVSSSIQSFCSTRHDSVHQFVFMQGGKTISPFSP